MKKKTLIIYGFCLISALFTTLVGNKFLSENIVANIEALANSEGRESSVTGPASIIECPGMHNWVYRECLSTNHNSCTPTPCYQL